MCELKNRNEYNNNNTLQHYITAITADSTTSESTRNC